MIITEEKRAELYKFNLKDCLPESIQTVLTRYDKDLTALWNEDDTQWEFYRIKNKGITKSEDLLHWQISAPTKSKLITVGIIDWLKKYDTNYQGYLSQDQMKNNWKRQFRKTASKSKEDHNKAIEDIKYGWKDGSHKFGTNRVQISVPITIGINQKTGKKVYAVKKKRELLIDGNINTV